MKETLLYHDTDGYKRVEFIPNCEVDLKALFDALLSDNTKNVIIHFVCGYVNTVRFTPEQFKKAFKSYTQIFGSNDKIYISTDYGTYIFKSIIVEYMKAGN